MIEDMSPETRAEIEHGRRYPAHDARLPRHQGLALICLLLFPVIIWFALTDINGTEFNYAEPGINCLIGLGPVVLITNCVVILAALARGWRLQERVGVVMLFAVFIPMAAVNVLFSTPWMFKERTERVQYRQRIYYINTNENNCTGIFEASCIPSLHYNLYECDAEGVWCHPMDCFPYEESQPPEPLDSDTVPTDPNDMIGWAVDQFGACTVLDQP